MRHLQATFGGLRFEVEDEIAEGDKVVQLATMSGRHTGPLIGREPTGKEFAVRHIYIWRIADDKIVEHWEAGMTSACSGSSASWTPLRPS